MDRFYDVIIIGGGPAGLSAAIYSARGKNRTLVLEKEKVGGQLNIAHLIANYPGVDALDGKDLALNMKVQAESFGAEILMADVTDIETEGAVKKVKTSRGDYYTFGIIIAAGSGAKKATFKGEKEFTGKGVAYCATCDGEFFQNKEVFVIGSDREAVEDALFLTKYADKVNVMVKGSEFLCNSSEQGKLTSNEKINVYLNQTITEVSGDEKITSVKFKNSVTDEEKVFENTNGYGVFVYQGSAPAREWLKGKVELNQQGFLITDKNQKTNVDGIYGAGDICVKGLRQVATAVSDGATAATFLGKYISPLKKSIDVSQYTDNENNEEKKADSSEFLSQDIKIQVKDIFGKFERNVIIKLNINNSALSDNMKGFAGEISQLSDKITVQENYSDAIEFPSIEIVNTATETGSVKFHGIPGGHEFNSFIIALYNAGTQGQPVDEKTLSAIKAVDKKTNIKIMVSLSCTMCPETVMSAQRIASLNTNVDAEMFDIGAFPDLKDKYNIMSVPCIIVNDENKYFGKKDISQMLEIIS